MVIECSDMGTGALKIVTKKLNDVVRTIPDTGSLGSTYLDPLQSLESYFVHGLAVVRHLVNSARPVNRLPPEILAEIFSLVTESAALERLGGPTTRELDLTQIRRLHALPSVCRYWHDVALGTRSFWPAVWFAPKRRGEVIREQEQPVHIHTPYPLEKDSSGPLSVYFSHSCPRKAKALLEKYATRTRELYLFFTGQVADTDDVSALLDALETVAGDALEHFAIRLCIENSGPRRELSLFSGCAPKLRSLAIEIGNLCPINTAFPALTHLVVSYAPWTLDTLLDLVSRCPRLEHAHLVWAPGSLASQALQREGRDRPKQQLQLGTIVHLRHMRRLTFTLRVRESVLCAAIDAFMSRLVLPPSCHVYLAPHLQDLNSKFIKAPLAAQFMLSVLEHWPSAPSAPSAPFTSSSTPPGMESENARVRIPRLRIDFDPNAELQLVHPRGPAAGSLTLRSCHAPAASIVREMLTILRSSSARAPFPSKSEFEFTEGTQELWVRAQLRRGSGDLEGALGLLRALPRLARLVVAGNPAAILQALALAAASSVDGIGDAEGEAGAGARVAVCPALDTLSVFVYSRGDAQAVRGTLVARARMGCPVRCLVVPAPLPGAKNPVTEEDVRALGELVEELVVVDTKGWERVEVDWWTGRLREACRGNAALARNLRCEWPTWEYVGCTK
ncbi:hypothetical protein GSI_07776 [Ganoderma sinense ZZ0214-1]|uniref:F-box domain-containing protein n=1 Tax=Ganoderma sinense ZZ0214-1 TaxID=1077348 RepID=A0A2G8S9E6_9APHY|nr:hypothetical protein GSI_07658 [Ganoderma sinense ZZ0214-1]PIL30198.1 hypothetical protein GSI_07776 [Ganoderma sinense ZZ0214-1]